MTPNWPLIISIVALVVSAFTFYKNYIAPFDPLITVGGWVFHFARAAASAPGIDTTRGDEFDPNSERILGAIVVPVVFTHEGGKPGVISDIILRVSRKGQNDNWIFEPRFNVDERAYLASQEPQSFTQWMESAFSPVAVAKSTQVRRFVFFQATINPLFPSGRIRVGIYDIHVLVRVNAEARYREVETINVDFTFNTLSNLAMGRYLPPTSSISEFRNRLRQ